VLFYSPSSLCGLSTKLPSLSLPSRPSIRRRELVSRTEAQTSPNSFPGNGTPIYDKPVTLTFTTSETRDPPLSSLGHCRNSRRCRSYRILGLLPLHTTPQSCTKKAGTCSRQRESSTVVHRQRGPENWLRACLESGHGNATTNAEESCQGMKGQE